MNTLDNQYQALLERVLEYGTQKNDRTGTGTLSVFGGQFIHNMQDGFPLLTTKKMAIKTMMTELKWFLKGDTNIKYLVDNGCNIWNGDAYKSYEKEFSNPVAIPNHTKLPKEEFINKIKTDDEFAKKWGELGPIYGRQWRDWNGKWKLTEEDNPNFEKWRQNLDRKGIDQISNLINDLKINPDSRRLMVNAWNVGELDQMTLPPCHYGFQCYSKEREGKRYLSLAWNQRSVDTFLGLPFNIASYGLLLTMIAKEVNMIPDQLVGNLGDVHLYSNHIEQAKEQVTREGYPLPQVQIKDGIHSNKPGDIKLVNYQSHPAIKAPLSN